MSNRELALALLRAIEHHDTAAMQASYASDVIQREFPNQLMPQGATRNYAQLMEAAERGRKLLSRQRFQLLSMIAEGDSVALECHWSGELAIAAPALGLAAGDQMTARFAQFLTFRDGKIIRHDTYDCFDDWRNGARCAD